MGGWGARSKWVVRVGAAVVVLAGGGLSAFWPRHGHVMMPPRGASPSMVAWTYMTALDVDDEDTALALSTPAHRDTAEVWLHNTASLRHATVTGSAPEADAAAQHPGAGFGEATQVRVSFDYRQHWWVDDPSMPDGHHAWGYLLVQVDGHWLVQDEGVA